MTLHNQVMSHYEKMDDAALEKTAACCRKLIAEHTIRDEREKEEREGKYGGFKYLHWMVPAWESALVIVETIISQRNG